MKRFVFLTLSLVLLLTIVPGCVTVQTPQSGPPSISIFDSNAGKGNEVPPVGQPSVIGSFSSNPTAINSGGTTTLSWNVTGANSVSIDHGIGQVDAAGTRLVSPSTSTVYTISATNSAGTVTRSSLTTVNSAPPTLTFGTFAVTNIMAGTEPSSSTGCSNLYATITANGAGTATYIWESADGGGYSYTWDITFPAAGTQKITLPVEMNGLPSGPYQVHVLTPNNVVSNSTYYTTCAP